jgi:hypothetical protein
MTIEDPHSGPLGADDEIREDEIPMDLDSQVMRLLRGFMGEYGAACADREPNPDGTVGGDFAQWLGERMGVYGADRAEVIGNLRVTDDAWDWLSTAHEEPPKLMVLHRMVELLQLMERPQPENEIAGVIMQIQVIYKDQTSTVIASKMGPAPDHPMTDAALVMNLRTTVNAAVDEIKAKGIDGLKEKAAPLEKRILTPGALGPGMPGAGSRIVRPDQLG